MSKNQKSIKKKPSYGVKEKGVFCAPPQEVWSSYSDFDHFVFELS